MTFNIEFNPWIVSVPWMHTRNAVTVDSKLPTATPKRIFAEGNSESCPHILGGPIIKNSFSTKASVKNVLKYWPNRWRLVQFAEFGCLLIYMVMRNWRKASRFLLQLYSSDWNYWKGTNCFCKAPTSFRGTGIHKGQEPDLSRRWWKGARSCRISIYLVFRRTRTEELTLKY